MATRRIAHVTEWPEGKWDATEWRGRNSIVTPIAWHRYWEFSGRSMVVIIMSEDWKLTYQDAKQIATEIATGKRSYWSIDTMSIINEEKRTWRKVW